MTVEGDVAEVVKRAVVEALQTMGGPPFEGLQATLVGQQAALEAQRAAWEKLGARVEEMHAAQTGMRELLEQLVRARETHLDTKLGMPSTPGRHTQVPN